MAANSIINTISSFASLTDPVLGGVLYSAYGLAPVLWICAVCFVISAVMEFFIQIPFQKQTVDGSILKTAKTDFAERALAAGVLFEICRGYEYIVILFSGVVSLAIAVKTKNIFKLLCFRNH